MRLTRDAQLLLDGMPNRDKVVAELSLLSKVFITREDIEAVVQRISRDKLEQSLQQREEKENICADNITHRIEILKDTDITGNSRATGRVDDFINYFRDRFNRIAGIFRGRGIGGLTKLNALKNNEGREVSSVCIVYDIRQSKKGNTLLEVEDEDGKALVVIRKEDIETMPHIISDDIILVTGKVFKEMIMATAIEFPDVTVFRDKPQINEDFTIAYLSDLHFGSKKFLEKQMGGFSEWLKKSEQGRKVAYVIIAGDVVDGIGIYPKQEQDLIVKDIEKQYGLFNEWCATLPDCVKLIVAPGNHDGVRRGEPQPQIAKDMLPNYAIAVSSPVSMKIHGITHLVYHGTSMDSMIAKIPKMSYHKPELCMREYLRRRHLSPIYGDNLIIPEHKDYMVIGTIPDVFHTGHVHTNGYSRYRGCHMINSGTFQDRTDYQVQLGHHPTPAQVPIYCPATDKVTQIDLMRWTA